MMILGSPYYRLVAIDDKALTAAENAARQLRSVPRVIATAWDALGQQGQAFVQAQGSANVMAMAGATGQSVLIMLPVAGLPGAEHVLGRGLRIGRGEIAVDQVIPGLRTHDAVD